MKTILIASKFIKKQLIMTFVLVFEVILSILLLSNLYTYIADYFSYSQTVKQISQDNLYTLEQFTYYYDHQDEVYKTLKSDKNIDKIGISELSNATIDDIDFNVAIYNNDMSLIYKPKLSRGTWFSDEKNNDYLEAVISKDIPLNLNNIYEIISNTNYHINIKIVGILKSPTQYISPSGISKDASSLISTNPAIIINDKNDIFHHAKDKNFKSRVYFISSANSLDDLKISYGKYGNIQPIKEKANNYYKSTKELILSQFLLFAIFFLLSAIIILSTEVIHTMKCQRIYSIYYLLGMKWQQCMYIEIIRHFIVFALIISVSYIINLYTSPMISLVERSPIGLYITIVLYLIFIFTISSFFFIRKLIKHDLSESIKLINKGE